MYNNSVLRRVKNAKKKRNFTKKMLKFGQLKSTIGSAMWDPNRRFANELNQILPNGSLSQANYDELLQLANEYNNTSAVALVNSNNGNNNNNGNNSNNNNNNNNRRNNRRYARSNHHRNESLKKREEFFRLVQLPVGWTEFEGSYSPPTDSDAEILIKQFVWNNKLHPFAEVGTRYDGGFVSKNGRHVNVPMIGEGDKSFYGALMKYKRNHSTFRQNTNAMRRRLANMEARRAAEEANRERREINHQISLEKKTLIQLVKALLQLYFNCINDKHHIFNTQGRRTQKNVSLFRGWIGKTMKNSGNILINSLRSNKNFGNLKKELRLREIQELFNSHSFISESTNNDGSYQEALNLLKKITNVNINDKGLLYSKSCRKTISDHINNIFNLKKSIDRRRR